MTVLLSEPVELSVRSPCLGFRPRFRPRFRPLFVSSLCAGLLLGCAQGGLTDEEVSAARGSSDDGDDEDDGSESTGSTDAGKDASSAAASRTDSGAKKDAGTTSGSGSSSDAGRPATSRTDAGAGALPTIKCPSNMVCTADISVVLSALDPNVKADTAVCAQSGLIPMPMSCKSDDECKSARLTSGTCKGSYCIQACVK